MAFHIIEGLPGGGKSYYAVEVAKQVWEEGGIVHTNLPLRMDVIEAKGWKDRTVLLPANPERWITRESKGKDSYGDEIIGYTSDIIQGGEEGAENVVIVDEASLKFRASKQLKEADKLEPIADLTKLQRHAGLDIYFLAQDSDHIPKVFRDLADTRTLCVNQANLPVVGPLLSRWSGTFRRIVKKGKSKQEFSSYTARFNPDVGELYETHGERGTLGLRTGGGRVKKSSITNKKLWVKLLVSLLACTGMITAGLWMTASQWDGMTKGEEVKPVAKTETVREVGEGGAIKEKQVAIRPPRPKGGLVLLEWDLYDEHVLAGVRRMPPQPEIRTRGGRKLRIGGDYEGQTIVLQFQSGGWWYFRTDQGRLVVVRPLLPEERENLPPVTIPKREERYQPAFIDSPSPVDDVLETVSTPFTK